MSRWFRLYDDLVDDPKIQRLPGETVKALLNLWCLASQNDGLLPAADDIAFKLRMKPSKVDHLLSVLGECGLIDSDETGLRPHNWNARQFKSDVSNERVKRHRERKCNVTQAVTETPPETEQIQIQKDSEPIGSGAEAPPDPSEPERQFFKRGKEVLGKSSGGQLAKLLKAAGGNVALARSKIELAATKDNAPEFIAKVITTAGTGPPARPLTQHQIERENSRRILDDLNKFATGGGQSQPDLGLLRHDPGDGPEGVHGGAGRDVIDLPATRSRQGG